MNSFEVIEIIRDQVIKTIGQCAFLINDNTNGIVTIKITKSIEIKSDKNEIFNLGKFENPEDIINSDLVRNLINETKYYFLDNDA